MGTQAVDFGPPPAKSQAVDFGPPPNQSQAVDFGPPPSKPGLFSRMGAALDVGSRVPGPVGAGASALRYLGGAAKQIGQDAVTLSNAAAPSAGVGAPGVGLGQVNRAPMPAGRDVRNAALRTGALLAFPGVAEAGEQALGRVVGPAAARLGGRVLAGAATGAASNPESPGTGAVIGAAGGGIAPGSEVGPATRGLRTGLADLIAPAAAAERRAALRAATTDALTGLGNQAAYRAALPTAEADAGTSIVRFDANGFKGVNDALGHQAGDQVLADMGNAVQAAAAKTGVPARAFRPGGDEFAALVPTEQAANFRDAVESEYGIRDHAPGVRSSLSGGIGATDAEADAATNARKAIHKAEQGIQGRNTAPEPAGAPTAPTVDFGPPPAAVATEAPPSAEPTGGAEANPTELQEMFSGPGLTSGARKSLRQFYRSGFVEPYPLLDQPADQALKATMQEGGASRTYGNALATYGVGSARSTVPAEKVPQIEAQINADNATARADARAKAGLDEEAANLRAHAANYQSIAGPDIRQDPDFAKYVNRFQSTVSPELKRLAIQGGLPEERLLSIPNGSPYVPMAADIEKAAPTPTLGPNIPRRPGTKLSSATERATGGAQDYLNDLAEQIRGVAGSRQKIAAENQLWQRVKDSGRSVTKDADLQPGEVRVAFTDKNQITTPNSPNATQYVAVPDRVASSVSDYLKRNAPSTGGADFFSRGLSKVRTAMTKADVKFAPIMTKVHGYNILSTVGQTPGASIAGNVAASLPFGSQVAGATGLAGVDFADPAVASKLIEYARYGGTHPIETHLGARPLFGAQGLDARGRYVLGTKREALHPEESPAQVAQYLTENMGNYNPANQPGFVRIGQSSGLTTFAPAGTAFTRSAARRTVPIFSGMTPGERLATLGRTLGSAVGAAEALNYANTGHSTFSNQPGHRLDIDRGSVNDQNQENYIRFGALFPMVDRGLRMTGVRPLIEGEGIGGIARAPINEALAQTGIPVRAAGAAFLNMQPRLGPNLVPELVTPPEFNQEKMLANMGARGFLGSVGAASAIAGTSPFDADRSLSQRTADAFGLNFGTQGTRGGKTPIPSGYDDKVQTELFRVYDAKTAADKQAVIQSAVKDAAAAGYPEWMIAKMKQKLSKAANKSAPHGAP